MSHHPLRHAAVVFIAECAVKARRVDHSLEMVCLAHGGKA